MATKMLVEEGRLFRTMNSMRGWSFSGLYNRARRTNLAVHKFAHKAQIIVKEKVEACNYFLKTLQDASISPAES